MAFQDFTFPGVLRELGLSVCDADLFSSVPATVVRDEFASFLRYGVELAVANGSDKAKSEFIIAPVLLELRRATNNGFSLFSGIDWGADPTRGLNGYCDFILTKGSTQYVFSAPFAAIAEAKNDNVLNGLGPCVAAMVATRISSEHATPPVRTIHGVVTTGTAWKFLLLQGNGLTIDVPEYYIGNLPKIMGILRHIVESV